ncbi:MAG: hypothetical protein AB8G11_21325 [Saprospiraceae bacterium]
MNTIYPKSYSKYTFQDLLNLGLDTEVTNIFEKQIKEVEPSDWLVQSLERGAAFSLNTEKAKSEFIIAPILNEVYTNNKDIFAVYSGFNFTVDSERGLQGFCDFLLAKLPLNIIPNRPIIAVVEAKLSQDLSAAIPQCAAEMFATRIWNERYGEPTKTVFGTVTTGDNWLFLRLDESMTVKVDKTNYSSSQLSKLLGVWDVIIDYFR